MPYLGLLELSLPLCFFLALPPGLDGLISGISGEHQSVAEEKEEDGEDRIVFLFSEYCVHLLVSVNMPFVE